MSVLFMVVCIRGLCPVAGEKYSNINLTFINQILILMQCSAALVKFTSYTKTSNYNPDNSTPLCLSLFFLFQVIVHGLCLFFFEYN